MQLNYYYGKCNPLPQKACRPAISHPLSVIITLSPPVSHSHAHYPDLTLHISKSRTPKQEVWLELACNISYCTDNGGRSCSGSPP